MRKRYFIFNIFVLLLFCLLSSCVEMETADDTAPKIPPKRPPREPTAQGIEYTFDSEPMASTSYSIPLPEGQSYNIAQPFNNLLRDWAELNFGRIVDNSLNEITIKIKNVDYDGGNKTFLKSIYLKINIQGSIQDKYFDKDISLSQSFSRSSAANPNFKGSSLANKAKTNLNRFLMLLVNKIDKFLKNEVGVKRL